MENDGTIKRRRDRLEVINDILDIAIDGAVKTRIMYKTNVNFHQFEDYVDGLMDAGLVEVLDSGSRRIYKTTEKGKMLLDRLRETSWIFNGSEKQQPIISAITKKGQTAYFIRR